MPSGRIGPNPRPLRRQSTPMNTQAGRARKSVPRLPNGWARRSLTPWSSPRSIRWPGCSTSAAPMSSGRRWRWASRWSTPTAPPICSCPKASCPARSARISATRCESTRARRSSPRWAILLASASGSIPNARSTRSSPRWKQRKRRSSSCAILACWPKRSRIPPSRPVTAPPKHATGRHSVASSNGWAKPRPAAPRPNCRRQRNCRRGATRPDC